MTVALSSLSAGSFTLASKSGERRSLLGPPLQSPGSLSAAHAVQALELKPAVLRVAEEPPKSQGPDHAH